MLNFIGTSLIVLPTDVAEMLNTQIGAERSWTGQYTVDCSKVSSLPDLSFYFDGKPYPLKGTDYIIDVKGTCISALTGLDINSSGGAPWIIGKILIRLRENARLFSCRWRLSQALLYGVRPGEKRHRFRHCCMRVILYHHPLPVVQIRCPFILEICLI